MASCTGLLRKWGNCSVLFSLFNLSQFVTFLLTNSTVFLFDCCICLLHVLMWACSIVIPIYSKYHLIYLWTERVQTGQGRGNFVVCQKPTQNLMPFLLLRLYIFNIIYIFKYNTNMIQIQHKYYTNIIKYNRN